MFNKMGADLEDPQTLSEAFKEYKQSGMLPESATIETAFLSFMDLRDSICLMSSSQSTAELQSCMQIMDQNEINRLQGQIDHIEQ